MKRAKVTAQFGVATWNLYGVTTTADKTYFAFRPDQRGLDEVIEVLMNKRSRNAISEAIRGFGRNTVQIRLIGCFVSHGAAQAAGRRLQIRHNEIHGAGRI
jgi:hypothetical protein